MKYLSSFMTVSTVLLLAGCSAGPGNLSSTSGSTMSGVAATGAPISGGKVEVKGANGVIVEDTTTATGSYQVNVASLAEPYLVRVIAPSGEKYISVASKSAVAEGKKINITPLTHTIVANVFKNANADDVFTNFETASSDFTEEKLKDEKDQLLQKFVSAGLVGSGKIASADIDLLNGDLQAGTSAGVDGLLDVIQVNTDAAAGIEIKLKGSNTALITDKVDALDPVIVPISLTELAAAEAQLDVIALLRIRMNSLAALHSSKVACNGAPVHDGSACDIDNLYNAFLPYFHANFQEEGNAGAEAGVWSWFCRIGSNDEEATTRDQCLASGSIFFENVLLKDITLINYNDTTKVALINFNFYLDGVLKGSEEMSLKLDTGANLYKLLGSKKTFKYYIETESLFDTAFDKSNTTANYQGVNSYSVNLNFYYKSSGLHTFNGSEMFTLTAASGHQIFPSNSASMNLYLVVGPSYDSNGTCSSGLAFSTTPNPYKTFDFTNGVTTYKNYATACATTPNPCDCHSASTYAYFDHDVAQKVSLSEAQVALMDKIENITLAGSGVAGDSFSIKKPLSVNAFNAANHIPSFGMSVASFCNDATFSTPLNLAVQSGTLNYVNLNHGFSDVGNTMWNNVSDSKNYWNDNLTSAVYIPNFTGTANTDIIRHSHLYLSANDEFERQFVRRVSCNGN